MTTTTESKAFQRRTALRILSIEGINYASELSEQFQHLFDLDSGDPEPFVQTLRFMREHVTDTEGFEAALYALGIEAISLENLEKRRNILLYKRHEGPKWTAHDAAIVEIQERDGFTIIAATYDFMAECKKDFEDRKARRELAIDPRD